jgi:type IV pilus assembly protein PilX
MLRRGTARGGLFQEKGVALVVALIMLVLVTIVGLAAVRGTTLLQKMASNQFDRQIAFQATEAALRAAQDAIGSSGTAAAIQSCNGSTACTANPFDVSSLASAAIPVPTSIYTASVGSVEQPTYIIEDMGSWSDPSSSTGFNQSANAAQRGAQGMSNTAEYYRVTARSGDPASVGDRAVVILQETIKQ